MMSDESPRHATARRGRRSGVSFHSSSGAAALAPSTSETSSSARPSSHRLTAKNGTGIASPLAGGIASTMPSATSRAVDDLGSWATPAADRKSSAVRSARQTICTSATPRSGPCSHRVTSGSGVGIGEVCTHASRWLGRRMGAWGLGARSPRSAASAGTASPLMPKSTSLGNSLSHCQVAPSAGPYTGSLSSV
jgi:hypothetical protein